MHLYNIRRNIKIGSSVRLFVRSWSWLGANWPAKSTLVEFIYVFIAEVARIWILPMTRNTPGISKFSTGRNGCLASCFWQSTVG
jgi:hypothetical protein